MNDEAPDKGRSEDVGQASKTDDSGAGRRASALDRMNPAEPWRRTEPCVEIRFPVEGAPSVIVLAFSEEDEQRVRVWFESRPDLAQLLDWCAEYAEDGVRTIQAVNWENLHRELLEEAA
jgi:hypothetical protein